MEPDIILFSCPVYSTSGSWSHSLSLVWDDFNQIKGCQNYGYQTSKRAYSTMYNQSQGIIMKVGAHNTLVKY